MGGQVIASVGTKFQRVQVLGADSVVNYRTQDLVTRVMALTSGRGVDVVLNQVAGSTMVGSIQMLSE
jgi:NADPH2:quinone reductase